MPTLLSSRLRQFDGNPQAEGLQRGICVTHDQVSIDTSGRIPAATDACATLYANSALLHDDDAHPLGASHAPAQRARGCGAKPDLPRAADSGDARYRLLFEHMREGVAHCRMIYENGVASDFTYLDVNAAFAASTGLSDVVDRRVSEVLPGFRESSATLFDLYARVARGGGTETLETHVPCIDKWLSISACSLADGEFMAVFADVSARKNAEKALVESREDFREIAETITEVFWVTDRDLSVMRYISPAYEALWGRSRESLYANPRSFIDAIHPEDRERVLVDLQAMAAGRGFDIEYRLLLPGGALRWIWDRGFPVEQADGRIDRYVGVAVDITERRIAEQRLSASEHRFRALIEGSSEPVAIVGPEGIIRYVSPAITSISGYQPAEYVGKNLTEFVHPQDREKLAQSLAAILEAPGQAHHHLGCYRRKDGSWANIETSARNLLGEAPINGIVVNLRDVTDRVRMEAALARSLAILATQQEASPDGILVVDPSGLVISQNQRFLELWRVPTALQGKIDDGQLLSYVLGVTADPETFIARVKHLYAHPLEHSREEVALKDGRVFDRYSAPMHGADGEYFGRVWFFRDITDSKRAEANLQRVNRALKTLSAGGSALIHAASEEALYAEMCRIAVEVGGYAMAWVGRPESDACRSVTPLTFAGNEAGYLRTAAISWADCERGRGATGSCLRSGMPQIVRATDPAAGPWRDEAARLGYAATIALPLKNRSGVFGSITIHASEPDAFDADEVRLLAQMADDLAFGVGVLRSKVENEQNLRRLGQAMESTVHAIASTLEMRDPYTAGHQLRVAKLCVAIARSMNLAEDRVRGLDLAASIHDLGKIGIPAEILSKPGRLNAIEMQLVRTHADVGHEILKNIHFPWPIAEMIRQHHERLDGSGYPRGLKGEEILLEARIIAVADVVEAMASHRPYRPGLGWQAALDEIVRQGGKQLDAEVVAACARLFHDGAFDPVLWESTVGPAVPATTTKPGPRTRTGTNAASFIQAPVVQVVQ